MVTIALKAAALRLSRFGSERFNHTSNLIQTWLDSWHERFATNMIFPLPISTVLYLVYTIAVLEADRSTPCEPDFWFDHFWEKLEGKTLLSHNLVIEWARMVDCGGDAIPTRAERPPPRQQQQSSSSHLTTGAPNATTFASSSSSYPPASTPEIILGTTSPALNSHVVMVSLPPTNTSTLSVPHQPYPLQAMVSQGYSTPPGVAFHYQHQPHRHHGGLLDTVDEMASQWMPQPALQRSEFMPVLSSCGHTGADFSDSRAAAAAVPAAAVAKSLEIDPQVCFAPEASFGDAGVSGGGDGGNSKESHLHSRRPSCQGFEFHG